MLQPLDGSVEPKVAIPRITRALIEDGLPVVQNCAVRGIETSGGAVSGVVTEKGAVSCQAVVVAGGVWSRAFLRNLGVSLPLLPVHSYMVRMPGFESEPAGASIGAGTAWQLENDGGYSISIPTNFAPGPVRQFPLPAQIRQDAGREPGQLQDRPEP